MFVSPSDEVCHPDAQLAMRAEQGGDSQEVTLVLAVLGGNIAAHSREDTALFLKDRKSSWGLAGLGQQLCICRV